MIKYYKLTGLSLAFLFLVCFAPEITIQCKTTDCGASQVDFDSPPGMDN